MGRSRVRALVTATVIFGLVVVPLFASQLGFLAGPASAPDWFGRVLFFRSFYLDFILFLIPGILLVNGPVLIRLLGYAWCLVFVAGYLLQLAAVRIGGEFVSFLAVDNVNHISLLLTPANVAAALGILVIWMAMVVHVERSPRRNTRTSVVLSVLALLALGTGIHLQESWAPKDAIAAAESLHGHRDNRMGRRSPIASFYNALFDSREVEGCRITPVELAAAGAHGITLRPNRRYPLVRESIYRSPVPYPSEIGPEKLNVIVLFSEGLSARTLDAYDGLKTGLTPNIEDFARHGMRVDNYYNHTFATYRGLHGQLCSMFPVRGGMGGWHTHYADVKSTGYLCLNHLFGNADYGTYFVDTHRRDKGYIDEMMLQLGFDRVVNAEDISGRFLPGEPLRADALSDNQLFTGLEKMLEEGEFSPDGRPFFLALYNLETHAWQAVGIDGRLYGNGENNILNAIHNYDHAFGRFWRWFRASDYYHNTMLVLTADHAHYNDRGFVNLVSGQVDYRPFFIDRIPLLIYRPGGGLPASYDAAGSTSLDFTPSMAHLLGLDNVPNPFLGHSIFDPKRPARVAGLAAAGDSYFRVVDSGVEMFRRDDEIDGDAAALRCVIDVTRDLEQHDRIWPRGGKDEGR